MAQIKVSELTVFPLKSGKGVSLQTSSVDDMGLEFDRRFLISDMKGQFITGRTHPKLSLIKTEVMASGAIFTAPNMPDIAIKYADMSTIYKHVVVWGSEIQGQYCSQALSDWFSRYLAVKCQLFYFGEKSQRTVNNFDSNVSFADGFPILLTSQASLDELNKLSVNPISMSQFRANIVVTGCEAFAEDSWKKIRIAGIEYELVKACERCVFTTLKPNSVIYDTDREPLKTLSLFRKDEQGKIDFGQNLLCHGAGDIKINDVVEVLESHKPKFYPDNRPKITRDVKPVVHQPYALKTPWNDETRLLCCVAVIKETPDTKTFRFRVEPATQVDYKPGQFITLNLKVDGQLVTRNYTLSSSPSRPDLLSITVKRVPGGKASNWLNDNLSVGDKVGASAPRGPFHAFTATRKKLLLLSAGSGITPMLSMARYYADTECDKDIVFFYSAKTEQDLIALAELKLLATQHINMKLVFTLTQVEAQSTWAGYQGRVDKQMLTDVVRDITDRAVYVCGPDAFMKTMKSILEAVGLPEDQYFQESFGDHAHSDVVGKQVNVLLDSWDVGFKGNNKTTLLEQAENNGVQIPYNCRAGYCGRCRVRLEQGEVRELADYGLEPKDKADNQVLACSCVPTTDVVITQV